MIFSCIWKEEEERLDIKFKITGENTRVLVLTPHGDKYTSVCEEII